MEARVAVPPLIKLSGEIKAATGSPRTGVLGVTFAIYAEQEGGSPLWLETQNVQLDAEGRYAVLLGAETSEGLPLEIFSTGEARWLEATVLDETSSLPAAGRPRILLVSVPYALKAADAETLGGKPPSAFVLAQTSATGDGTEAGGSEPTAEGTIEPQQVVSGTAGFLAKFLNSTDLGDSVVFEDGSGNLGIGTTTPGVKVDIRDSVNGPVGLFVFNTAPGGNTAAFGEVRVRATGVSGGLAAWPADFVQAARRDRVGLASFSDAAGINIEAPGAGQDIRFFTGGLNERVRIDTAGNVGIGGAPSVKLDVRGSLNGSVGMRVFNTALAGNTAAVAEMRVGAVGVTGGLSAWPADFVQAARRDRVGLSSFSDAAGINVEAPGAGQDIRFFTGGLNERVRIDSSGNVGIGTASPTQKLDVTGTVKATAFVGNGSGLTNLDATMLTGFISSSGFVVQQTAGTPNLIGGFSGNTAAGGVVGASIGGGGQSGFINQVNGNFGTVGGGQNNTVSGGGGTVGGGGGNTAGGASATFATVAGGLSNTASGDLSTVAGGGANTASAQHATVGGGQNNLAGGLIATVGGGTDNTASGDFSTVGAGQNNMASGTGATVGGGRNNTASFFDTTVAGGFSNTASGSTAAVGGGTGNTASGISATVGGGNANTAGANFATVAGGSGNASSGAASTVPGGQLNTAQGAFSFAAGRRAKANHQGAFVWGDSTDADVASTGANQFVIRAAGGIRIVDGFLSLNENNIFLNGDGPEGDSAILFYDGTGPLAAFGESISWDESDDRFEISNDLAVTGDVKLGSNAELFACGSGENLRIVRGTVAPNGTIFHGSGFTVAKPAAGRYTVTWNVSFRQPTTVIVNRTNAPETGECGATLATETSIDISCQCSGAPEVCTDNFFSFIAIGPR